MINLGLLHPKGLVVVRWLTPAKLRNFLPIMHTVEKWINILFTLQYCSQEKILKLKCFAIVENYVETF